MNNISRLFLTLSVAGLIGVLRTPTAQADDKVYPGTMCVRLQGGILSSNDNGLFNIGNTAMLVRCPIVRDNTTLPWNTLQVVVFDRDPSVPSNVVCTAFSHRRDGLSFFAANRQTAGSSANAQFLNFTPLTEFDNGYFHFRCSIPPIVNGNPSGIASYFIREP
ncbi:MAG TPA: hypothetical protein VGX03_11810 [Candidatus Binatia bacterium]|jgi:hypothetical protein|nr:hypothetical protein [Candidatus Binatia bacterium]